MAPGALGIGVVAAFSASMAQTLEKAILGHLEYNIRVRNAHPLEVP
jgi:hypothetical protein